MTSHRPTPKSSSGPGEQSAKRISLTLSASLHRELKLVALDEEETLNSLIIAMIRSSLKERQQTLTRVLAQQQRLNRCK
jgi:hypothetical protein